MTSTMDADEISPVGPLTPAAGPLTAVYMPPGGDAGASRRFSSTTGSERHKLMVSYLFNKLLSQSWIPPPTFNSTRTSSTSTPSSSGPPPPTYHGLLLRQTRGVYVTAPSPVHPHLLQSIVNLNVEIAFTMASPITDSIFAMIEPRQTDLVVSDEGFMYQIVESLEDMATSTRRVKKLQYACLIRRERVVVLWSDRVADILTHAAEVERKLLALIWGSTDPVPGIPPSTTGFQTPPAPSRHNSYQGHATYGPRRDSLPASRRGSVPASPAASSLNFSLPTPPANAALPADVLQRYPYPPMQTPAEEKVPPVMKFQDTEIEDDEKLMSRESVGRPLVVTSAIFVGLSLMILVVLLGGVTTRQLLIEIMTDGNYTRLALVVLYPIIGLVSLFFFIVIFTNIFRAVGPIASVQSNSRFYSAIAPDLGLAYRQGFRPPHITIQMPVYKEGLRTVLQPTIESLRAAISHYELNGGSANIFVNDDGIQPFLFSKSEDEEKKAADRALAEERMDFYHDHNIGWVARPPHNHEGFIRAGKFKKASNMNYALDISNRTEDKILAVLAEREGEEKIVSHQEEEELYERSLESVLAEEPMALAGGNIRIGELILIVDSDTRVPVECLLYSAAEMYLNPEVAIIQHNAGVMQVVGDYFENAITFFTDIIYTSIRFAVGHGEAAAFVGHNAFLRWQAIQAVSRPGEGGKQLFWSENSVSEDFDMALRLQVSGNIVRMASYHGEAFKEGVSLTVHDELARWEKYAYGCNELVFNPIHTWLWRGPFTGLFIKSLTTRSLPLSSKISILGYIFSYYGIASGLPLTVLNYFLIGWFNGYIDKFYLESWKVFVTLTVIFAGVSNVTLALLRYRLGEKGFFASLLENIKWAPAFFVFFGGLSFHLNLAILSHMFSINMEWGATAKEAEFSNFFKEMPKIFKNYKWMFMFCIPMVGAMIFLGNWAPRGYEITGITAVVPLAICLGNHILMPFVLSPALMVFNY